MAEENEIKAYFVQGDEYGVTVFATCNVVARREGANELDEPFGSVSCRRLPVADKYILDRNALQRALVEEMGFWQECAHCEAHVSDETEGRVWDGSTVFCDAGCKSRNEALMQKWAKSQEDL